MLISRKEKRANTPSLSINLRVHSVGADFRVSLRDTMSNTVRKPVNNIAAKYSEVISHFVRIKKMRKKAKIKSEIILPLM